MKLNVLSRSDGEWSGAHDGLSTARASRNPAAHLHAPARALDVQRAVTAAKISRTLARPFLFAPAPSHIDGVYGLARSRAEVALMASCAADGEVRLWHLPSRTARTWANPKPAAFARDLCFSSDSARIFVATDAKLVHCVSVDAEGEQDPKSLTSYRSTAPLASISASYAQPQFATAAEAVLVWDEARSAPLQTLGESSHNVHCVRYCPVEPHLVASAAADRSVVLYDVRANSQIRRLVLRMRSNDIAWNPLEAMNFVVASDDHNCYSYDMRKLSQARTVHKDHVAAVMSVDFSPTGQEFVSGGYDKTIRIFPHNQGRRREVYHTRRMQRVFGVQFSLDGDYVVSGSDDGDVRVWKSERSRPLQPLFRQEKEKVQAADKLIDRYQGLPQVRRIAKKRHVPGHVKSMRDTKRIMQKSQKRKQKNVRKHTKRENREAPLPDRKKNIVRELE